MTRRLDPAREPPEGAAPAMPPRLGRLARACADRFGVPIDRLVSHRRDAQTVRARQVLYFLARERLQYSYPKIGRAIGGFHHTSVLSGVRRVERELQSSSALRDDIGEICGAWERAARG